MFYPQGLIKLLEKQWFKLKNYIKNKMNKKGVLEHENVKKD